MGGRGWYIGPDNCIQPIGLQNTLSRLWNTDIHIIKISMHAGNLSSYQHCIIALTLVRLMITLPAVASDK